MKFFIVIALSILVVALAQLGQADEGAGDVAGDALGGLIKQLLALVGKLVGQLIKLGVPGLEDVAKALKSLPVVGGIVGDVTKTASSLPAVGGAVSGLLGGQ